MPTWGRADGDSQCYSSACTMRGQSHRLAVATLSRRPSTTLSPRVQATAPPDVMPQTAPAGLIADA
nr:MAG TPA: hypothetical protein [Caudoviricetes sp.]